MRLRIEEKIRLGYIPKKKIRYCKECGVKVGKKKQFCDDCLIKRRKRQSERDYEKYRKSLPPRKCKECGIEVSKGKSYCPTCFNSHRRKYPICGFEGCKELRGFGIHSCENHSSKNQDIRFMEEIVSCNDCGCDLGKRKNHKYQRFCNDCSEIRKDNGKKEQLIYYDKWFKNKYHTDEDFRKRHLEYQSKYRKEREKTDEEYRKRNVEYRKNYYRKKKKSLMKI